MSKIIKTREDVTEEILNVVWDVVEGWYLDEPIDWEDCLNRAEKHQEWEFGEQWDDPAIKYVQRTMRQWKREVNL